MSASEDFLVVVDGFCPFALADEVALALEGVHEQFFRLNQVDEVCLFAADVAVVEVGALGDLAAVGDADHRGRLGHRLRAISSCSVSVFFFSASASVRRAAASSLSFLSSMARAELSLMDFSNNTRSSSMAWMVCGVGAGALRMARWRSMVARTSSRVCLLDFLGSGRLESVEDSVWGARMKANIFQQLERLPAKRRSRACAKRE